MAAGKHPKDSRNPRARKLSISIHNCDARLIERVIDGEGLPSKSAFFQRLMAQAITAKLPIVADYISPARPG